MTLSPPSSVIGYLHLLQPRWFSMRNRLRIQRSGSFMRILLVLGLTFAFWAAIFFLFYRVIVYFNAVETIGPMLTRKLLSLVYLTFFSMLLLSNIITSLTTFFLSQDLTLLVAAPQSTSRIYYARLTETLFDSSWMFILFGLPVFLAFGLAQKAGLLFYPYVFAVGVPFLLIPAALGSIFTLILVNVFPARRTKDLFILLSLLFLAILIPLLRFLQPEKLTDPESFSGLVDYFALLRNPASPLLPSFWATEVLNSSTGALSLYGSPLFYWALLASTGLGLAVLGETFYGRFFRRSFTRSQESMMLPVASGGWVRRLVDLPMRLIPSSSRVLVEKDVKTFLRDTSQWSQLILLVALMAIYLFNIKALPLQKNPLPTVYLQNVLAFLNLGLAGFVLAGVGIRFVFPAVSMEGNAVWILKSAPLSASRFLWSKFWLSLVPLLFLAEALVISSNSLLHVTPTMMILSTVTIFCMTFGITSLGIAVGTYHPRFNASNSAQVASSFGGLIYMILALIFIALVVVLEAGPVYRVMRWTLWGWQSPDLWRLLIPMGAVVLINVTAFILPMKLAVRKLNELEL